MHDLDEGMLCYSTSKTLESLIIDEKIPMEVINNRIKTLPYSDAEKSNKPRPISISTGKKGHSKIKIRQSAGEMLCLVKYLSLMIGDLVPVKNRY